MPGHKEDIVGAELLTETWPAAGFRVELMSVLSYLLLQPPDEKETLPLQLQELALGQRPS